MVKDGGVDPLRIGILGMEGKTLSTFKLFLQGPCRNKAVPVAEQSAEAFLIDMDGHKAVEMLSKQREQFPDRPIIITSLKNLDLEGTIYVAKPIKTPAMLAALDKAKTMSSSPKRIPLTAKSNLPSGKVEATVSRQLASTTDGVEKVACGVEKVEEAAENKPRIRNLHPKKSTHQTAMLLDEKSYSSFVGAVADIDPRDPHHVAKAHYNKHNYLQAYVESAVRMARGRKRILQLKCGWQPITIFPHSNEVWVDADDKQIRAFCVVPISSIMDVDVFGANSNPQSMISPVNPGKIEVDRDPKKFQAIDSFIWKIALWTSNGRVPKGVHLDQPVYLERWPNLTRFVNIPHSLRIAAVLVDRPMPLLDVANVLQIRQQYVFSFFSAAMALGLAGQAKSRTVSVDTVPQRTAPQRTGLLQKLLNRLKVG